MARQRIFQDGAEREDFVQRLARLATAEALTVYAGALLPNHFQPLVRYGSRRWLLAPSGSGFILRN